MEVKSVKISSYEIPLKEPFVTSLKPIPELERVLIEVQTDEGIVGFGEAAPAYEVTGETQGSTAQVLSDVLGPALIGENPLLLNQVMSKLRGLVDGSPTAHAAIEMALQDIRGKSAEMPLFKLLGGATETTHIEVPKVLSIKSPEEMAKDAENAISDGYEQIKIKVGEDAKKDTDRIQAVSEAIPSDTSVKIDANQGWEDAKTTIKAVSEVEHLIDVVEQPVTKNNVTDLKHLRSTLSVPIMPDEAVESESDVLQLIRNSAGDMYNIKLMKSGGIDKAMRINSIAAADNRPTQLGSMVEGGVGTAAGVHFVLAFENVIWNEMVGPFMTTDGITDLHSDTPEIEVEGPGLGVSINKTRLDELRSNMITVT